MISFLSADPQFHYCTVCLTSIYHPQIGGKFTATPGVLTNIFYGCIHQLNEWTSKRNLKFAVAPLEVGHEFAPNYKVGLKRLAVNLLNTDHHHCVHIGASDQYLMPAAPLLCIATTVPCILFAVPWVRPKPPLSWPNWLSLSSPCYKRIPDILWSRGSPKTHQPWYIIWWWLHCIP